MVKEWWKRCKERYTKYISIFCSRSSLFIFSSPSFNLPSFPVYFYRISNKLKSKLLSNEFLSYWTTKYNYCLGGMIYIHINCLDLKYNKLGMNCTRGVKNLIVFFVHSSCLNALSFNISYRKCIRHIYRKMNFLLPINWPAWDSLTL